MYEFQLYASLLIALLVLLYTWPFFSRRLSLSAKNKGYNLPPSPPTLPIIGNLHQFGQLPHRSVWELSKKYGPLMLLRLGSKPTLVVSSADAAKEILKTHDRAFAGRPQFTAYKKLFYDLKDLVFSPYGVQWRTLRSIVVHELLTNTRVKSFNSIRDEETALLVEKINRCSLSQEPVDLSSMFMVLANDIISRAAFGKKHSETEHGRKFLKVFDEGLAALNRYTLGEFVPWLGWINSFNGYNAALDKIAKEIDESLDAIVEEHLNNAYPSETSNKENFVDILHGIYKGNTPGVSIDFITLKAIIMDVFGAGTDSSSATMGWIMTELMQHPNVMKELKDEIRAIMNGRQQITDQDLEKMHYMKAVIKETLRCHPPLASYFHEATEHVNLMGYDIAPETYIFINVWAIGRDPAYWQEPDKFMPDRFLSTNSVDFKGFDFQLLPFGAGRRICPGIGFANSNIEFVLANLTYKFDWELPKGANSDVIERAGLTNGREDPLIVVPTKCHLITHT